MSDGDDERRDGLWSWAVDLLEVAWSRRNKAAIRGALDRARSNCRVIRPPPDDEARAPWSEMDEQAWWRRVDGLALRFGCLLVLLGGVLIPMFVLIMVIVLVLALVFGA